MESGGGEWGEVAVLDGDLVRACSDRAGGENVVVRVMVNDLEEIIRSDLQEGSGGEFHIVHQGGQGSVPGMRNFPRVSKVTFLPRR